MFYEYEQNELDDDNLASLELLSINSLNNFNPSILDVFSFNQVKNENEENSEIGRMIWCEQPTIKSNKLFIITRKRGRKANPLTFLQQKRIHDKFSDDNIKRKIKSSYFTFILNYTNEILKAMGINEKFKNINYKYKSIVNKKYFSFLKNSTIGNILSQSISPKFKTKPDKINKIIYEKIIGNPIIKNFLNEKYFNLFQNIYYKNERNINMEKYGLKEIIKLTNKIEMYKEFILKNKKIFDEKSNDGNKYIKTLEECTKKYFLIN